MVSDPESKGIPASVTAVSLGAMDHFSLSVHDMKKTAELLYSGDRIPERTSGPKIGRDGKWQYNLFSPDGTRAEIMEVAFDLPSKAVFQSDTCEWSRRNHEISSPLMGARSLLRAREDPVGVSKKAGCMLMPRSTLQQLRMERMRIRSSLHP